VNDSGGRTAELAVNRPLPTRGAAAVRIGREGIMLKGFKAFLMRGNLLDLAVAVIIGAAFGAVVKALVTDLLMPIIAAIAGKPDFANLYFTINGSKFMYGDFFNAVVAFVLVAAAIYFFVIVPVTGVIARSRRGRPIDPTEKTCPYCLSEIPVAATRCAFCTSDLTDSSPASATGAATDDAAAAPIV
jgi:large conductance mechanosensitive channel